MNYGDEEVAAMKIYVLKTSVIRNAVMRIVRMVLMGMAMIVCCDEDC